MVEHVLMDMADAMVDHLPYPRPSGKKLERGKIISHRGEHLGADMVENTIAAFDRAEAAGVWGIEMDLHWTGDGEPVVIHDPDLQRLYAIRQKICDYSFDALRRQFPAIPALAEVIERYGRKLHLMIEIKTVPMDGSRQCRLEGILKPLAPAKDFHLLSLHRDMLSTLSGIPPSALVAVAARLPHGLSRWVLKHRWGGLCGHYCLIGDAMVRRHHAAGQKVGIGYARSRKSLFRELNRGIDWIFSNNASELQAILKGAIHDQAV